MKVRHLPVSRLRKLPSHRSNFSPPREINGRTRISICVPRVQTNTRAQPSEKMTAYCCVAVTCAIRSVTDTVSRAGIANNTIPPPRRASRTVTRPCLAIAVVFKTSGACRFLLYLMVSLTSTARPARASRSETAKPKGWVTGTVFRWPETSGFPNVSGCTEPTDSDASLPAMATGMSARASSTMTAASED